MMSDFDWTVCSSEISSFFVFAGIIIRFFSLNYFEFLLHSLARWAASGARLAPRRKNTTPKATS
jgi:hypothetical protein